MRIRRNEQKIRRTARLGTVPRWQTYFAVFSSYVMAEFLAVMYSQAKFAWGQVWPTAAVFISAWAAVAGLVYAGRYPSSKIKKKVRDISITIMMLITMVIPLYPWILRGWTYVLPLGALFAYWARSRIARLYAPREDEASLPTSQEVTLGDVLRDTVTGEIPVTMPSPFSTEGPRAW